MTLPTAKRAVHASVEELRVWKLLGGSDSVGVIAFSRSSVNLNLKTERMSTVKQESMLRLQQQILSISGNILHGSSRSYSAVAMGVT